ncbi:GPR139 [Branchiostoma lanceolatum]|uniref:GPR139 protein n=1 Tax=Branchiostoma lanceolatum TaxID=7740 RepID=A0A8K0AFS5_BRALA|nr:GPR139 [Branchiostoma lanceolatum]
MEALHIANHIYYTVLAAFGLPTNVLTIWILMQCRKKPGETKSTSSLYLIALAAADSLVLIFIVIIERVVHSLILGSRVSFGLFCPWLIWLDYGAHNASIWIIVAYTTERFVAVHFPIWRHRVCKPSTAKAIIAAVFALSYLFALPHFFSEEPKTFTSGNATFFICDLREDISAAYRLTLIWGQSTLSFFLPFVFIIVQNGLIIHRLRGLRRVQQTSLSLGGNNGLKNSSSPVERDDNSQASNSRRAQNITPCETFPLQPPQESPRQEHTQGTRPRSDTDTQGRPRLLTTSSVANPCQVRAKVSTPSNIPLRPTTRISNKPIYNLLTISTVFVLLWLPRLVYLLKLRINNIDRHAELSWRLGSDISNMLGLLNSSINIFLYCFADKRFRQDLVRILTCGRRQSVPVVNMLRNADTFCGDSVALGH